jgi:hypothetical protein
MLQFKTWLESTEQALLLPNFEKEARLASIQFQNDVRSGLYPKHEFDDPIILDGLKYQKQVENIYNKDGFGTVSVLPGEDMYDIADLIKLGQELNKDKDYKKLLDYLVDELGAKKFVHHLLNQENFGYSYSNQLSKNSPSSNRVRNSIKTLGENNPKLQEFMGSLDNTRNFLKRMLEKGVIDEDRFNEIL